MNNTLFLKDYIDIQAFPFPKVFKGEVLWDPIKNLKEFISLAFEKGLISPNYKDSKNVYLGEGTKVSEGALIEGPAIIGKNCTIAHGALLRENCLLGDHVYIGHASEVKNSIFLNNARASHLNYVGDSIVGNNVNIAAGAIVANFRLDKKVVTIKLGKELLSTDLLKFGAVIGDNCSIGINSVLNPGTVLGKNTVVYPLSSARGVYKEGEVVKGVS